MTNPPSRSARQAAKLEAALSELEMLDLDALRSRWHRLVGRPAPVTFRVSLLRAALAYKRQEQVQGGVKASTRRLLHRVADAADPARRDHLASSDGQAGTPPNPAVSRSTQAEPASGRRRTPSPPLRIKPGTRLLRTWQGGTHEVLVGDDGVSYRGQAYRSLSEVARLITGQRWSGPLFFGLKRRASPGSGAASELAAEPGSQTGAEPGQEPRP